MHLNTKHKRYFKIVETLMFIVGLILFVFVSSFMIYKIGDFLITISVDYKEKGFALFDDNLDSISAGDASALEAVDSVVKNSTSTSSPGKTPPYSDFQYVILSLDGSRSLSMWNKTRQFAKDMAEKGKPVHFTYFINPIYLITKEAAHKSYQPPRAKMGQSLIGYADSEQDVKDRVEQINYAYNEGHEIGSHNVGHFNGLNWSHDEWLQESNSFDSIITDVQKNNPNVVIQPWTFGLSQFIGFRAPELGVNSSLYKVLAEKKYVYDSSGMRTPTKYPTKDQNGIWHIGLGIIKVKDLHSASPGKSHYVLSMDYNFWMLQSNVKNVAKKGTPLWNNFFSEMKDSYLDYFNNNYEGNHAPVVIGHHFSSWNDGVYWEAMKSFAEDVCGKPKVKCVTFKEYTDYLNSTVK